MFHYIFVFLYFLILLFEGLIAEYGRGWTVPDQSSLKFRKAFSVFMLFYISIPHAHKDNSQLKLVTCVHE